MDPNTPIPINQTRESEFKNTAKKTNTLFISIIVILILLLTAGGVFGAYILLSKDKDQEENDNNQTNNQTEEEENNDIVDNNDNNEIIEDSDKDDKYKDWITYENELLEIELKHPEGWIVEDDCFARSVSESCNIKIFKGDFEWIFEVDPVVTGGGWGFLISSPTSGGTTFLTEVSPLGFDSFIITKYIDTAEAETYFGGQKDFPDNVEIWENSVLFTDPEDSTTLGFGDGEMYDDVYGNFFGIFYKFSGLDEDRPIKGAPELEENLELMDKMTNSMKIKE